MNVSVSNHQIGVEPQKNPLNIIITHSKRCALNDSIFITSGPERGVGNISWSSGFSYSAAGATVATRWRQTPPRLRNSE